MPLGGSITQGVGSSHGNGYRGDLVYLLKANGYVVEMVGSRKMGTMLENAHEGWRGFRVDEIDKKAKRCVANLRPNVFMVNAGSNDCLQGFGLDHIGARMTDLLENLWTSSPGSTVILSTLVVHRNPEINARVMAANNAFRALVEEKATQQKRIILADMSTSGGPTMEDLGEDDTHPGDLGYKKMAGIWFHAIDEATKRDFII